MNRVALVCTAGLLALGASGSMYDSFVSPDDASRPWTYWLWENSHVDEKTIREDLADSFVRGVRDGDKDDLDELQEGFSFPPDKSKPWTYWLWMNGLTDEQTIIEDLEDIKRLGFGGVLLNDARGYWEDDDHIVTPPAEHAWMSAPQVRKYALAMRTAHRLGLKMAINTSPNGGKLCGPWKVGADAPKRLLVSTRPLRPGEAVADEPIPPIAHFKPIACFAVQTAEPLAARDWYAGGDGLFSMSASSGRRIDVGHGRRSALAAVEVTAGWQTPAEGHWSLVRFGFATMEGREYDVDILDPGAIRRHFDRFFAPLKAEFGDLIGTTLTGLYSVSWEGAVPNWSPDFEADFRELTGENLRPNLPLLAGFSLPCSDVEAFMTKYRRARNDMFRRNFYGTFAEIARREGLHWFSESGGPWVRRKEVFGEADQLEFLSVNDVPQGEFWEMAGYGLRPFVRHVDARTGRWHIRGAVNAAHIYDKSLVSVEAFTHMMQHWSVDPATLKPVGDIGFADGANRYLWHTYTSSPTRFGMPGIEYFAGSHINRNVTWHDDAKAFVTYLGRCQHLLQAGRPVTDIAVLGGNRTYSHWGRFRDNPSNEPHLDVTIPKGFAYDLVNDDALARNPALLKRYKVVYDVRKPENRGKIVPVGSLVPDAHGPFDWAHRRTDAEEWYFIIGEGTAEMTFRATAPAVETWDAVSGERRIARAEATGDGRTRVALDLPVGGSVFVMFLPRPTTDLPPQDGAHERTVAEVQGPWRVSFSYPRGISAEAPGPVTLHELVDFTTREDLKFFSGTATYRAAFVLPSGRMRAATGLRQVRLSLGEVLSGLAHVYLNGVDCGTVWCAPWEADVTAALKDGRNELEIRYVNNWMNRLTGDCELPASARVTKSDLHYWTKARTLDKVPWDDYFDIRPTPFSGPAKGDPLQPSGILGPVRIRTVGGREE